jgi:hypothetical protein
MHLKDETLHAHLDHQLDDRARLGVEQHLSGCHACRERLERITTLSSKVALHLAVLNPSPQESPRSAAQAIKRLQPKEKQPMFKHLLRSPKWAALSLLVVLAFAFAFQPVRALAGNFLNLFRVEQITLLPMDMSDLRGSSGEPTIAEAMGRMFSDSMVITRESSGPIETDGWLAASQQVGFDVRLVPDGSIVDLRIKRGPAFEFTFNRDRAQAILDETGRSDLQIPTNLDNILIEADIAYSVTATFGDCAFSPGHPPFDPDEASLPQSEDCLHLVQMGSPTVNITPDIDPAPLAEIGLRFLGMNEAEARDFSQSVDWATTLVIPFPRGEVNAYQIEVDGVTGNLLVEKEPDSDGPARYTLLWVKDEIIYALTGAGDPQKGIDFAGELVYP